MFAIKGSTCKPYTRTSQSYIIHAQTTATNDAPQVRGGKSSLFSHIGDPGGGANDEVIQPTFICVHYSAKLDQKGVGVGRWGGGGSSMLSGKPTLLPTQSMADFTKIPESHFAEQASSLVFTSDRGPLQSNTLHLPTRKTGSPWADLIHVGA